MSWKQVLFVVLSLLSVKALARNDLPFIEVKKVAYVEGDQIKLGALLITNKIEHKIEGQIRDVVMGETPPMGEELVFTDRAVSEILRREVSRISGPHGVFVFNRIPLRIPSEIHVMRASPMLNDTNFRAELTRVLQAECETCEFEYSRIRVPPPRPGMEGVRWSIQASRSRIRGPFNVRVDYHPLDTATSPGEWVTGEVRMFKTVAISERALRVADRLQPQDYKMVRRDITYANDSSPHETELLGARMKRSLRAFDPISRQDIEIEKTVNRGESVELVVASDGMKVSLKAVAQDGGMVGEMVRVQNPMSKKILSGVVTAKGLVEAR